jgi:translation elongation factor P/translation initiation factor 5A
MRTNINFAVNFSRDYPDYLVNKWACSLSKGDLILVDGKPAVYLSHKTYEAPTGMGGYKVRTSFKVVIGSETVEVNDKYNKIKAI